MKENGRLYISLTFKYQEQKKREFQELMVPLTLIFILEPLGEN